MTCAPVILETKAHEVWVTVLATGQGWCWAGMEVKRMAVPLLPRATQSHAQGCQTPAGTVSWSFWQPRWGGAPVPATAEGQSGTQHGELCALCVRLAL